MNLRASPLRRLWSVACLAFCLMLPAHADGWAVRRVPDPQGGPSRCMLESSRQVIDDGYTKTTVRVRVDARLVQVDTESDIDLSFGDAGLRVDDGNLLRPDTVHAQQDLVFLKGAVRFNKLLRQGRVLYVDLRFWPTWPSQGRRTVRYDLDGVAPAFARLPAGC
jgi:hypothetical protein